MNGVKKFSTFDELKSCENKTIEHSISLKKQDNFKKQIMEMRIIKTRQKIAKSKQ